MNAATRTAAALQAKQFESMEKRQPIARCTEDSIHQVGMRLVPSLIAFAVIATAGSAAATSESAA